MVTAPPMLDLARFAQTPVSAQPFPHVVVPDFLPAAAREAVFAALPADPRGGSFPPDALKLGAAARALVSEMEGCALREAIAEKFGLALDGAPTMLTMRVACREKDGQIHTDSDAKRVTVLLYLNPDRPEFAERRGCLRLLGQDRDIEDFVVEVPPTHGTLLVFPNGPGTWHGHLPYVGPRFSIQLNYMTDDAKARSELRRHKISAFVKRLRLAA